MINIRPASSEDLERMFQWRNDPWIVALGSLNNTVTLEEHTAWFNKTLANDDWQLFIIEKDATPIGQVRFQRDNDSCFISIYIMKEYTGQGLGVEAMQRACQHIFAQWSVQTIYAQIKKSNKTSQSGFAKAGFERDQNDKCDNQHYMYCMTRTMSEKIAKI